MINVVFLHGNLGHDPQILEPDDDHPKLRAKFSLAVNRPHAADGSERPPDWFSIYAYGRWAEIARDHLVKGRAVTVQGRLRTFSWEDEEGNRRHGIDVVASSLTFYGNTATKESEPETASEDE